LWRSLVSYFIQTPSINECILPESSHHLKGDSAPKRVGGEWRAPCTIRDATAIARQSVCWRLKKHAKFIAADFISLWPTHGFRSPVGMRQWTICSRAGTWPSRSKLTGLGLRSRSTNLLLGEPAIGRHRDEKALRRRCRTASLCCRTRRHPALSPLGWRPAECLGNAIRSRAGQHRDREQSRADDPERKQYEGQIAGKRPHLVGGRASIAVYPLVSLLKTLSM
jgi:hypothetical protein